MVNGPVGDGLWSGAGGLFEPETGYLTASVTVAAPVLPFAPAFTVILKIPRFRGVPEIAEIFRL